MDVVCKVVLSISIGVKEEKLSFLVVEALRPKVIISLRGLKTLEAEIYAKQDCVRCHGIIIPFKSETFVDSLYTKNEYAARQIGASLRVN